MKPIALLIGCCLFLSSCDDKNNLASNNHSKKEKPTNQVNAQSVQNDSQKKINSTNKTLLVEYDERHVYVFSAEFNESNECHPCSAPVRLDILSFDNNGTPVVTKSWKNLDEEKDLVFPSGSFGSAPSLEIQKSTNGEKRLLVTGSYTAQGYIGKRLSSYYLEDEGLTLISSRLTCTDPDGKITEGEC